MVDIGSIGAAITTATAAMDLGKRIFESGLDLKNAQAKLEMAELIKTLATITTQLAAAELESLQKEKEIRELREKLETKGKVKFERHFYWLIEGSEDDGPFCPQCWDKDKLLMRLKDLHNSHRLCTNCKNTYSTQPPQQINLRRRWNPFGDND